MEFNKRGKTLKKKREHITTTPLSKFVNVHKKITPPKSSRAKNKVSPQKFTPKHAPKKAKTPHLKPISGVKSDFLVPITRPLTSKKKITTPNQGKQKQPHSECHRVAGTPLHGIETKINQTSLFEMPLPSYDSVMFNEIFNAKVEICTRKLDGKILIDSPEYKTRTECLTDISKFVEIKDITLTEEQKKMLVDVIEANTVRQMRSGNKNNRFYDDLNIVQTPLALHNTIAYSILIHLFENYFNDQCFTLDFLMKMIALTATTDSTERDIIILFISQVLKVRHDVVIPIISRIESYIFDFMESSDFPGRIWALLKILNNFFDAIDPRPFEAFFMNCVLPLASHMFFTYFDFQYTTMSKTFYNTVPNTIDYMLFHWPQQVIDKQVSFIMNISDLLMILEPEQQEPFIEPFFQQVSRAVSYSSPKYSITALRIYSDEDFIPILIRFKEIIFPLYAPPVFEAMENHWSDEVRTVAAETAEILMKIDEDLALSATIGKKEEKQNSMEIWKGLITDAENNNDLDTESIKKSLVKAFIVD